MAKAVAEGIPKLRIEECAARRQARIDSGSVPVRILPRKAPHSDVICPKYTKRLYSLEDACFLTVHGPKGRQLTICGL